MTQVKICGLTRPEDVRAAEDAGAAYAGVILAKGSPRTISPSRAEELFAGSTVKRVGVFVNETTYRLVDTAAQLELSVVQLHGDESPNVANAIRRRTGAEVWKGVSIRNVEDFDNAVARYDGYVTGLLLDGWSAVARGGTGTRFPWEAVAERRDLLTSDLQLIVAGGLHPGNVATVVELLEPDVVDVSSGVESALGIKDEELIRAFADAARAAAPNGVG